MVEGEENPWSVCASDFMLELPGDSNPPLPEHFACVTSLFNTACGGRKDWGPGVDRDAEEDVESADHGGLLCDGCRDCVLFVAAMFKGAGTGLRLPTLGACGIGNPSRRASGM